MALNGLANINVELTSRCNKACWMCGRRERDRLYQDLAYGDMDFEMVAEIGRQVPPDIVIQLHNNGEGLLYPRFGEAVALFKRQGCITNIVTNGKLLVAKAQEIIDNLDTISISVFEKDTEAEEQYDLIGEFLRLKGDRKPFTTLRLIGDVDPARYQKFNALIIRRILHSPRGSFNYRKKHPTIPEIGICLDFLNHLAIDRRGNVSVCVRFDPHGDLVLGNIGQQSLDELWNCQKRRNMMALHVAGRRRDIPFCAACQFWGVPTGE
jgi:radical SAM protein with 4Fe4S-binding SPASM domain